MNNTSLPSYSIDELAALAELPRRTVRYYIQQGLLDRPIGEKRSAYYTTTHLEQLLTIRKWQQAGLSLDRIREILTDPHDSFLPPLRPRGAGTVEVWSHLVVSDGLEITLEPSRAGLSSEQVREFFRSVTTLYEQIKQEG
ncbi:MAG: helix-turn-helix domain-containing protein [Gallionella sp.]|nr:helix-turn-helix domain-containing protein [Gallionella sp.]